MENDKELLLQNVRFVRNTDNTVCAYLENKNENMLKNIDTDQILTIQNNSIDFVEKYGMNKEKVYGFFDGTYILQTLSNLANCEALTSQMFSKYMKHIFMNGLDLYDRAAQSSFVHNVPVTVGDIKQACQYMHEQFKKEYWQKLNHERELARQKELENSNENTGM